MYQFFQASNRFNGEILEAKLDMKKLAPNANPNDYGWLAAYHAAKKHGLRLGDVAADEIQ